MQTRREFIAATSAAAGATVLASAKDAHGTKTLKRRPFGDTGASVTQLCLGGYHVGGKSAKVAESLVETAIEEGVRFFDTARQYQDGQSETHYGNFLSPKYRDDVFIMTKSELTTGKKVKEALETSLKLMKTDYLDAWMVHTIRSEKDVEERFKNGVIEEFFKAKEKGMVKHIGFTGHRSYKAHLHMLKMLKEEGLEMDACLMPINLVDPHYDSYIVNVLPELEKRNYAILAMKTLAYGRMLGTASERDKKAGVQPRSLKEKGIGLEEMHNYVYSLPISSLVSGCDTPEHIRTNAETSRKFTGMEKKEQERLVNLAEEFSGRGMEFYKA